MDVPFFLCARESRFYRALTETSASIRFDPFARIPLIFFPDGFRNPSRLKIANIIAAFLYVISMRATCERDALP